VRSRLLAIALVAAAAVACLDTTAEVRVRDPEPSGETRSPSPSPTAPPSSSTGPFSIRFLTPPVRAGEQAMFTIEGRARGASHLLTTRVELGDGSSRNVMPACSGDPSPPPIADDEEMHSSSRRLGHVWEEPGTYRLVVTLSSPCREGVEGHVVTADVVVE